MQFTIKETGETVELSYIWNGDDTTAETMCNYGFEFDFENPVISQDDFEWWKDAFARLEALDETGIDFSEYADELTDSDLETLICTMEQIANR